MKHDARLRLIVRALVSAFARRPFFFSLRRLGAGRIRNTLALRGERVCVFGNLEEISVRDLLVDNFCLETSKLTNRGKIDKINVFFRNFLLL